jgi:hypothetical protein
MKADFNVAISVPLSVAPNRGKAAGRQTESRQSTIVATAADRSAHGDGDSHGAVASRRACEGSGGTGEACGRDGGEGEAGDESLNLAPDIQEPLLFLDEARPAESELRKLLTNADWEPQRRVRGNQLVEQ